jgi:hypothetical protein
VTFICAFDSYILITFPTHVINLLIHVLGLHPMVLHSKMTKHILSALVGANHTPIGMVYVYFVATLYAPLLTSVHFNLYHSTFLGSTSFCQIIILF